MQPHSTVPAATLRQDGLGRQYARHHPTAEPLTLARKPNYSFEKRKKELDRKAKKDAKREDRRRRREEGQTENVDAPVAPTASGEHGQPGFEPPVI
jgi:hypothetical protein